MSPLVTIIIPNYNHDKFLAERLRSILDQTFQDFELIILDDASQDNSLKAIEETLSTYPHRLIRNTVNSGCPCAQWIKGIKLAKGRYIWIAESDDTCEPTFLDSMVTLLGRGAVLAYCRTTAIDSEGNTINGQGFWPDTFDSTRWKNGFTLSSRRLCQQFMTRGNVIPNASSVVFQKPRENLLSSLAKATRDTRFTGDWLFWCYYLMRTGGLVHFEPAELSAFRYHGHTTRNVEGWGTVDRVKEKKRFREYSRAVQLILQIAHPRPGLHWLMLAASGSWDWIFSEYLFRFQPRWHEKIFIFAIYGPLRLGFYIRLLNSKSTRARYWNAA